MTCNHFRAKIAVQASFKHLYNKAMEVTMSSKRPFFPKLLGFCGYATSGKNTAAEELNKILKSQNINVEYKIVGFADSLKGDIKPCVDFCKEYGIDIKTSEFKKEFRPMWVLWSRVAKAVTNDTFIWVKRLFKLIDQCHDDFAICDVRYDYEVEEIIRRGGIVIFITRPGITYPNDEEKQSFEAIKNKYHNLITEYAVNNDGTKKELGLKVFERVVIYG